jgi:hypothetical protein
MTVVNTSEITLLSEGCTLSHNSGVHHVMATKDPPENLNGSDHLEEILRNRILKWILKDTGMKMWTRLN